MKVLITGGGGFVGSNLVHVFRTAGDDVLAPSSSELDVTDEAAVLAYAEEHRPDAIVHAAIWNAFAGLLSDRRRAWDSFVGATSAVTDAADAVGARMVLVSTDWVFDGTQGPAAEDDPPAIRLNVLSNASMVGACSARHGVTAWPTGWDGNWRRADAWRLTTFCRFVPSALE